MGKFPVLKVKINRDVETLFRRTAKKYFPREFYSLLLGTLVGDSVTVDELYIPDDVTDHCERSAVIIQPHWITDAEEIGRESGLTVVGDCHSHCYSIEETNSTLQDRSQSEKDLDHPIKFPICGICVIQEMPRSGVLYLRSSFRWWGPSIPTKITRVNKTG